MIAELRDDERGWPILKRRTDPWRRRAQWTTDCSTAWLGATPKEAMDRARQGLARADPHCDMKATVEQIDLPEADEPPEEDDLWKDEPEGEVGE